MREIEADWLGSAAHRRWLAVLAALAGAVVTWKVAALALAHSSRAVDADIAPLAISLTLAGAVFVVCGLLVLWRRPARASLIFAGFALCSGLHWGGPLELPSGQLRTGLMLLYLLISGVLAACLLLHFALVFPPRWLPTKGRLAIRALYLPFWLALALAVAGTFTPEAGLRRTAMDGFLGLHTVVSNLFSGAALFVVLVRLARRGAAHPQKRHLVLLVAGMLIAWIPYLVASGLGLPADAWNLTVVALPIAATLAIFGAIPEPRSPD